MEITKELACLLVCLHLSSVSSAHSTHTRSLWRAVNIAKDLNQEDLPMQMNEDGIPITDNDLSDRFADYFEEKVMNLASNVAINPTVYNGIRRVQCTDVNFMTRENILKAIKEIKIKNSEGHDRIPQRLIIDGIDLLITPLTRLFYNIYDRMEIPEQWKLAKITPVHKKGDKTNIHNYRPIANLCEATKIYERLILQRIQEIEKEENIDLTGKNQHGFKRELF